MIILKDYYELLMNRDIPTEEAAEMRREALNRYEQKLLVQGWQISIGEGGVISPDDSTVLYTTRSPYHGQLFQNSREGEENFELFKNEFIKSGDFIEV